MSTNVPTDRPKLFLIGSSIMEQWHRPADLAPHHTVVNRAIGGTTTAYWVEHLAAMLAAEKPDAVFAYVGSNDLAQEVPGHAIAAGVARIREIISAHSARLPFAYLAIIKAPQRLGRFHEIAAANDAIRQKLPSADLWLESDPFFLNASGEPHAHLYIEDGLHLQPQTYTALTRHLTSNLRAWLNVGP